MKFWRSFLAFVGALLVSSSLFFCQPAQAIDLNSIVVNNNQIFAVNDRRNAADDMYATEFADKLDLNNSDIRSFRELRGFYPKLASLIIQNAPYDSVEEVLSIPGLSESQKSRLESNIDRFIVKPTNAVFNEGDERYNPGLY